MSHKLSLLVLAASALSIAACTDVPGVNNGNSGYFPTADAPLVPPNTVDTGDASATLPRQQQSGYFPTADAPLVPPYASSVGDASATLPRQQQSGYFPAPDAPLVSSSPNYR